MLDSLEYEKLIFLKYRLLTLANVEMYNGNIEGYVDYKLQCLDVQEEMDKIRCKYKTETLMLMSLN